MNRDVTSEEKLLKLIRVKDKGNILDDSATPKRKQSSDARSKRKFNITLLRNLNIVLMVACCIVLVLAIVSYFIVEQQDVEIITRLKKDIVKIKSSVSDEEKPLKYYKDLVGSRDLFQLPWEHKVDGIVETGEDIGIGSQLRVLGIMLDDNSQVVLENVETQETYVLSEGDEVMGATVMKIKEDKIILTYKGERIELIH